MLNNIRKEKMKKFFVLAALVGLFLVGCQDASMNPVSNDNSQISKVKSLASSNFNNNSVTQTIDGSQGGTITFTKTNVGLDGIQEVNINLTFKPGAFEGTRDITVTANFNDASFSFYPHMVFDNNSKVTLNANYTGVDLTNLNLSNLPKIDFYYLGDDGSKELIKNNGTKIDLTSGSIGVKNAKLPHFSRYGWAT